MCIVYLSVLTMRIYFVVERGGEVWAMAGVQGKVAFGLSHFCIEVFQKKF